MAIVGFNFSKIDVERSKIPLESYSVKRDISVKNIRNKEIGLGKDQAAFEADFSYTLFYLNDKNKDIGKIILSGSFVFLGEPKLINETISIYKKDKSINKKIISSLYNYTFQKCTMQSLLLSKEINLPPPLNLPKLKIDEK